ncbi:right-handed parallel beta-helix repeat-containing protein [Chiayiivirga flava]|uniref:Right handed beta helix domain-containing protein n=1 Tax=Chiayiivirga flava TaxID=659595 RepID=A0A7W8G207_9GAMM|nr:right-handed parallel beta-helix repeat-containing protein [Chiayiivirga flava]MBB5208175.1 hypothetical protein [Chiayiivirga flava]
MPMCTRVTAAALLCLAAASVGAGVISPVNPWTVGTGIECEFGSIQSALDAAASAPGPQTIRVTRLLTYTNQALLVNDVDSVAIEGGYAGCFSARDGERTALDGGTSQPAVRVTGPGNVTLRQLDIGVRGVSHTGAGTLALENVRLHGVNASAAAVSVTGTGALSVAESVIEGNAGGGVLSNTTGAVSIALTTIAGQGAYGLRVQESGGVLLAGLQVIGNGLVNIDMAGTGALRIVDSVVEDAQRGIQHAGSGRLDLTAVRVAHHGTGASCVPGNSGNGGMSIDGTGGDAVLAEVEIVDNCGFRGGGLRVAGDRLVRIRDSRIAGNTATDGGGIAIGSSDETVGPRVHLEADAIVEDNAAESGGGIRLERAALDMTQAPRHAIRNNSATREGGGMLVIDGTVAIGSGQPGGSIAGNHAETGGGGVYLSGRSDLRLYTTDGAVPAGIVGNSVGGNALGGGISAYPYGGSIRIFVFDARIVDNDAPVGGGVTMVAFGSGTGAAFCMGTARRAGGACADFDGGDLPPDARACADPAQCNLIAGNRGEGVFGGAALFRAADNTADPVPMRIVGARVVGNVGRSVLTSMPADAVSGPPDGNVEILDSILAGNTATNALLDSAPPGVVNFPPDAAFAMGPVRIERSTIAGNGIGTDYVIGKRLDLHVIESIVYQPFLSVHAGNAAGIDARSVIVENGAGLPVRADIVRADPLLTDAANGDVRPLPGSPALDFSDLGSGGFDVDGIPRGQDAPGAPTRFGLRDLGAHELGAARLFADDFEGN